MTLVGNSEVAAAPFHETWEKSEEIFVNLNSIYMEKIEDLCAKEKKGVLNEIISAEDKQFNVNVTLPERPHDIKNTWGTFEGNLLKWKSFHDCFVARIHNNDSIAPAYKFSYLKNSLTGEAAKTLGEWHLTDASYEEAWKRLKQIYDKKYPITREYLRQFYQLEAIDDRPTVYALQKLSNVTHETIRQLRAMEVSVDLWDIFFVHHLHEKLDAATARQWDLYRNSEMPTANEILDFIYKQAAALLN